MTSFSAFGGKVEPDFLGTFENASIRINVTVAPKGPGLCSAGKGSPAEAGWTFDSPGGERSIFVHYSSVKELGCQLVVNETVVQEHALFEPNAAPQCVDWRYQANVRLQPGPNTISIRSANGAMPRVLALAVARPEAKGRPTVDEYFHQLQSERTRSETKAPFVLNPRDFAGMVHALRGMLTDDAAVRRLASVLGQAVTAGQQNTLNGQAWLSWGGPLNGQRVRQQIFERLMRLGVDVIAETGTYMGTSTAYFARHGVPVYSCESSEEFFAAALAQLVDYRNINLHLQDSRAFLRSLADDGRFNFELPLFYLDAHGGEDLPVVEEIRIIRERWSRFLIMIDDFQVPGADYLFDKYGRGQELTLDYLGRQGMDLSDLAVLFPTASAAAETNARRGVLLLAPRELYDQHLRQERLLFRYATEPLAAAAERA